MPPDAAPNDPPAVHLWLMLVLTFSTGVIDAVGYLGLDRVFAANMTGNIVILGMGLVGADGLPVLGPLLALAGFTVGAAVTGVLLRDSHKRWTTRVTVVLVAVAAVLAAVATVLAVTGHPGETWALAVTAVIAAAMGAQAAAARRLAIQDITTVVVTSTLVGLAADSWTTRGTTASAWRRRLGAIALIGAGAAAGAASLRLGIWLGVAIAAALTLTVAIVGHLRRPTPH